ncbi:hypothetical protein RRG08_020268 [Elysia crispata]|uniref:Uncharacterized protein n=1 Tax=Elysia crispata TaxID=231223 RepID=A0AAE1D792_9GAST|nr:hypothetical protein RRG08_020268 [Elysia crispata]
MTRPTGPAAARTAADTSSRRQNEAPGILMSPFCFVPLCHRGPVSLAVSTTITVLFPDLQSNFLKSQVSNTEMLLTHFDLV